jgi:hypothetical protein
MSSETTQNTTAGATAAATPGQEAYEEEHVHSVYEQIASHFSSTRYKVGILHTSILIHQSHSSPFPIQENKKRSSHPRNPRGQTFSCKKIGLTVVGHRMIIKKHVS